MNTNEVPLLVTIPHSGEKIPPQTPWLKTLPEEILMCDVDRYVDFCTNRPCINWKSLS